MNHKLCVRGAVLSLVLLFSLLIPFSAFAQQIQLTGSVIDSTGEPIIGASVIEKGTTNGLITDFDGNFSLNVDPQATIVVSYVGYKSEEIALNGRRNIQIILKEDALMLEETVVIGYGTMKKSDMTGSISSVDVEELSKRTTTNAAEALQGKVAGVNIQRAGGNAGAPIQVKIRGVNTFKNNQPLYVIDGFPGDIENVNPQDIASMEVLKDGAAAAIYGSIAANGVIIITTKNGKKGETKVDFSSYFSFTDVAEKLDILNANEYKQVHKQMYENYNNQYPRSAVSLPAYITKDSDINTDWQDAMLRNGISQSYMVSIRGGADNSQYAISYNHSDDKGIFRGNEYRQDNARAKLRMSKYIFDFDANLSLRFTNSEQPQYSLKEMYMLSPLVPIYDESNEYGYGLTNFDGIPNNRNVMADNNYQTATNKKYYVVGNIGITANITPWLNYKTSYNYRNEHRRSSYHAPTYIADEKAKREFPYYSETTSYWEEHVFDNVINFNKDFDKHRVNVMMGSSITAENYTWNSVGVEGKTTIYKVENGKLVTSTQPGGFLDENFSTIGAGTGGTYSGSGSKYKYNRASFFGRLNYNYDNRYLLQVTMRRDGSSKFDKDNRWGNFPSVALAWRISEEAFFPKDAVINNLKLRASWGRLGNENALGFYDFQSLISTYNTKYQGYVKGNGGNAWVGSIARGLEKRPQKWETTDSKNIGVDFGLFNNKLNGAVNFYNNSTKDLLITKTLAPSAGISSPILNVGKIRNKGIEIELNYGDRIQAFDYNVGFNVSTTRNKVKSLAEEGQVLYGEGLKWGTEHFPTQTRVGKPIGAFYLYKTNGIFQNEDEVKAHVNSKGQLLQPNARPGDIRFVDVDGNGVIDDEDKVYKGSGIPKLEANLNLSAGYKGFDFSVILGSSWGHKLYNGNKYFFEGMNSGSNFLRSTLKAWTPENTKTSVPRAIYKDPNGNLKESDRFLEKGDFIRMRQVQLGYAVPKSVLTNLYLEKLRFYISGENLWTWTNYSGIDPEFARDHDTDNNGILSTGIDNLIYPFTRSFTVGVQLTF